MPPRPVAKARADAAQRAQLTAGRLIDVSDADTDATLARVRRLTAPRRHRRPRGSLDEDRPSGAQGP